MNNKQGKEDPWKRWKKWMNNREGKEGSWKRGKRGMKTKEGKEEPWKRGKVKPEKRTKGWPIEWKRKNPRKKSQKLASLAFEIFVRGFSLFHFLGHLSLPFFRFGHPSLP